MDSVWLAHQFFEARDAGFVQALLVTQQQIQTALDDHYLLACQRYIELNPVRAAIVRHPADYPWSSYRANAQGRACTLVSPHPLYLGLGADPGARQTAYRDLFRGELDLDLIHQIRAAANSGFVLGNPRFQHQIALALQRRVTPAKRGPKAKRTGSADVQCRLAFAASE